MAGSGIKNKIFNILYEEDFNTLALEIFLLQYENNTIYKKYVNCIYSDITQIKHYKQIPFLPVDFFKTHKIITGNNTAQIIFGSSGTTANARSFHHVSDITIYKKSAVAAFKEFYGKIEDYTILALLPSYLERNDSSLIWMINSFINQSNFKADCGFYVNDYNVILKKIKILNNNSSRKILLFGVSYALLELAEKIDFPLTNVIVMETGGMKGMKKELVREELHHILCEKFRTSYIHSEYGMTELLSQAYSQGKGIFRCPNWMKILIREMNDPFDYTETGQKGGINVVDFANINSCSFIETQDVGKLHEDGSFEVSGRIDYSDIRGCNLLTV